MFNHIIDSFEYIRYAGGKYPPVLSKSQCFDKIFTYAIFAIDFGVIICYNTYVININKL